jgi:glycosyltransferase involved in cell wall biosynthesis
VIQINPAVTPSRRPKLLLIENSHHFTGAFKAALAIADALHTIYDIEFVLPSQSTLKSAIEKKGLICHQLPMVQLGRSWPKLVRYAPYLLINTFRLRRLMFMRNVEILVVNDYYNLLGIMAKLTGWRGRLLTIVRLMPMNQQRVLNRVWTALAINFSHTVIAVSQAVRGQLPKKDKVQVIYDPLKCEEKYAAVMKTNAPDGAIRCLYLANYIAGKGHVDALEAFSRAYAINPALRLRFVGSDMGLKKNKLLKQSLQEKVEFLGLAEAVSVDGASDDVEKEIKDSDIVLNFSESESFSQTCAEACTFGRPIIATNCGGPNEIIDNGVSGLLVPVNDVQTMTDALLTLSRNAALRQSMGMAGRTIIRERFSEQNFIRAFNKLCETSSK